MRVIESLEQLEGLVGQEIAISEWIEVSQERVNQFADATGDHQWIHVDVERSKRESPFGGPVAHGYLTLSLLPALMKTAIEMRNVKMGVNYGLNRVRFMSPVPVGSRLRARAKLLSVDSIDPPKNAPDLKGAQVIMQVTIEREGSERPVCVAETISRRYS